MKSKRIVIVGAGGSSKEILWNILDCKKNGSNYDFLGFIDDNSSIHGKKINNYPVLGSVESYLDQNKADVNWIVGIADPKIRKKIVKKLETHKVKFCSIIHPSVIMSKFVKIGDGTIIQPGCILTVDIEIGNHVHINTNCSVAHDSIIDDFVTISPGTTINGVNRVMTGSYLGTGTITKEEITIGKWSITAAGSVLIKNIPDYSLFAGVPAKLKKKI